MEWSPALFGFVGALIGATAPSLLQARRAKVVRLEDAYADLAGASALLLRMSIADLFGEGSSDEAWVRFGVARARVLLQETDARCRTQVIDLSTTLDDLYSVNVRLDADPSSEEERARKALEHLRKMKVVEAGLERLLGTARERLMDVLAE